MAIGESFDPVPVVYIAEELVYGGSQRKDLLT
jgi:hypothetical protein